MLVLMADQDLDAAEHAAATLRHNTLLPTLESVAGFASAGAELDEVARARLQVGARRRAQARQRALPADARVAGARARGALHALRRWAMSDGTSDEQVQVAIALLTARKSASPCDDSPPIPTP